MCNLVQYPFIIYYKAPTINLSKGKQNEEYI